MPSYARRLNRITRTMERITNSISLHKNGRVGPLGPFRAGAAVITLPRYVSGAVIQSRRIVMRLMAIWAITLVVWFAGVLHAQPSFSIRAASEDAVAGWEKMESADHGKFAWVSPVVTVTPEDVETARPVMNDDGQLIIVVAFTDVGAKKMRDLTTAQLEKLIALVLDGKLIWAPKVRSILDKEAVLSGNGPHGLTMEQVQRLMSTLHK
jgi:hypothetical protein